MRVPEAARGPDTSFYRTLVTGNTELLRKIMEFNGDIRQEHLRNILKRIGLRDTVPEKPGFQENVFGTRLCRDDPPPCFWDFEEESRRLALLEADTLKKLLLSWGTIFCAPLITHLVRRDDRERLIQEIAPEYLELAREKGRFLLGDISGILQLTQRTAQPENIPSLILHYAFRGMGMCMAPWPEALYTIMIRKLTTLYGDLVRDLPEQDSVTPQQTRAIWFSTKKILLREVAPQWSICFS